MRFKIFAAALSAVVLSAAFQSAEAGFVIDNFNVGSVAVSGTSAESNDNPQISTINTPSGDSGFDKRDVSTSYSQLGGGSRTLQTFYSSFSENAGGNGLGVLTMGKDLLTSGTSHSSLGQNGTMFWYRQDGGSVDLTKTGTSEDGLRVVVSAASNVGVTQLLPTSEFNAFDVNGNTASWNLPLASGSYWTNYATDWTYASPGFDWTQVLSLSFAMTRQASMGGPANSALLGNPAFATSVSFDSIQVVPEPSTYAMALAGVACGAWQMVRRRRAR